ncbi:MAG: Smr/MutS family protein [Verrucomicrobiaceae bacterium]|nr:Smr/MutS family protein [Verrucomicrobiaceae bacterium]
MPEESDIPDQPVVIPITGELDLHAFQPRELGTLLPDYFEECRRAGILTVRVVHGKGTGALRTSVHALLQRLPGIQGWTWPLDATSGGWGATLVRLA